MLSVRLCLCMCCACADVWGGMWRCVCVHACVCIVARISGYLVFSFSAWFRLSSFLVIFSEIWGGKAWTLCLLVCQCLSLVPSWLKRYKNASFLPVWKVLHPKWKEWMNVRPGKLDLLFCISHSICMWSGGAHCKNYLVKKSTECWLQFYGSLIGEYVVCREFSHHPSSPSQFH